jgi:sugar lactone lactonase YvrE
MKTGRLAGILSGLLCMGGSAAARAEPVFGDVKVLATVPNPPGSPEGLAVRNGRVYVAGPAKTGTILSGPSKVLQFDADSGQLLATWPTQGENILGEHANSCLAFDGHDRLYVLNTQIGMYRIDITTGAQSAYSTPFPDLPACNLLVTSNCSPTPLDMPPLPNDVAFAVNGDAYVTDSFQATIWRVPVGGGVPQIWFQDPRLASLYIGVNGVRLDPSATQLYVTVTTDLLARSFVYRLPLVAQPTAADMTEFHAFALGDSADGIAFGATGKLYVTLALPTSSGFVVLRQDGSEETRVTNDPLSPTVPYDSPANLAFDGTGSVFVVNHALLTNLPSHFTVLKVFVGDVGWPLLTPRFP